MAELKEGQKVKVNGKAGVVKHVVDESRVDVQVGNEVISVRPGDCTTKAEED